MLGGLGNQLYIYAFGRALELNYGVEVRYDTYSGFKKDTYKRKFELYNFNVKIKNTTLFDSLFFPIRKRSEALAKILYPGSAYFEEDQNLSVNKIILLSKQFKKIYLQGYFQKAEYFQSIKNELIAEISLIKELSLKAKNYLSQINERNAVAVHIRRKERKDLVPLEFYLSEIDSMKKKISNPKFFIFSDEIEWCKNNLSDYYEYVYVDTEDHIEDFWLMKNCKHFIIGNSTFSWWASWLCDNRNKIVIIP